MHIVTGAFSNLGKHITRLLVEQGARVRTLTGHPDRPNPFGGRVEAAPFNFDDPAALVESLRGAATVFNTYWVRFSRGATTLDRAVENSQTLIRAALDAGVPRFVHISITNPSEDSPLEYFRGKAIVERSLIESGLSYAILRPAVLFGGEDILINNIAWFLRRLPAFAIFGSGEYRIQPVHVGDLARLAVQAAKQRERVVLDAVCPETYTLEGLIRLIRQEVGSRCRLVHLPPGMALVGTRLLGLLVRDVIMTREEMAGLMANLLVSDSPPTCPTRFSEWLQLHARSLGVHYISEVAKHYK
jgi:NADH dehydrogenase